MMKRKMYFLSLILMSTIISCFTQPNKQIMEDKKNKKFSCDIETGVCAPTNNIEISEITLKKQEKVKLIYFTDPICSACWAIEPELKKFKLEYGEYVEMDYHMGGLLPNWDGFNDSGNGISKPSDVSHHWDEVGSSSGMSIDGDIWLEEPLVSSYPPSIAYMAMEKQGKQKALDFLRIIREMVFLEKINITKEKYLILAAEKCNGDVAMFLNDYHSEVMKQSFKDKITEGRDMGIRGFPTFVFVGKEGNGFKISGMSGYDNYVLALEKALGKKIEPKPILLSELQLLNKYKYLSTREVSFVLSQDMELTIANLEKLVKNGFVKIEKQKYGNFWRLLD